MPPIKKNKIWDYSTLSSFQTCRKRYYYEHVLCIRPKAPSGALTFGGAIHEGLDEYYKNDRDLVKAIQAFTKAHVEIEGETLRTLEHGIKLLTVYAQKYKDEPFKVLGKPEEGFVFTIGDELYGGRMDLLVDWDGATWLVEHKSTTRLGNSYFDQFDLDKQVTGYIIATEEYLGRKCQGCIINVMEPWKEVIRKSARTKAPEDHFLRKPLNRSQRLKDQFKNNVLRIIRDIRWCHENDEFYEAEKKESCFYYNRSCPYIALCKYGEDERIIKNEFVHEVWEPFKVEDTEKGGNEK